MHRLTNKLSTRTLHQSVSLMNKRKNGRVSITSSCRSYSTKSSEKSGIGKPILYLLGSAVIGSGGVLAYAKYDDRFRKHLNEFVPGSDSLIKFVCQEEKSYGDSIKDGISGISNEALNKIYQLLGYGEKSNESAVAPPPSLLPIKTKKSTRSEDTATKKQPVVEIESNKEKINATSAKETSTRESILSNEIEQKPSSPKSEKEKSSGKPKGKQVKSEDFQKYDIPSLEKKAVEMAQKAMLAFNVATTNLKEYREEVSELVDKSVRDDNFDIWLRIKEKTKQKEKCICQAEKLGRKAMKKLEHLKLLISDEKIDIDEDLKSKVENNIKNVLNDLVYSKAVFTKERNDSSISEKYARKVKESRQDLSKELGVLFPSLVLDSQVLVTEEELDLFVIFTCQLLNFYRKEVEKLESVQKSKFDKIIEQSKAGNPEVMKEMLSVKSEALKRNFVQELMKKELKLKLEFENELRTLLRKQVEAHNDHLQEVISLKDKETERKLKQNITERVEDLRVNYNRQLAKIIGRMKGLDKALKEKAVAEKQAKRSQSLWTACQSLILSIKTATNVKSWEEQLKPLQGEVNAISKAAVENDPLVEAVLSSIPSEALSRGVFSELALRDRFLNVEKVAFRLANLPEGFISIPRILLSYLQSCLLINLSGTITSEELANEPTDVSVLNNYDILFRARYWLDRGDFLQTVKYMNSLKGASRAIADEWIKETLILLETQQAADVLLSHAVYSNLIYLQDSS